MPIPTPQTDETHDDFISRCMSDEIMLNEYPDDDQRNAVCETQWKTNEENAAPMKVERRVIPSDEVELRVKRDSDGKPTSLSGYAAVFNKRSVNLGFFVEQIEPGAFTNAMKSSDVRALYNHDSNQLLGRTKSGTLTLVEDDKGLRFDVTLPDTQIAKDVAESVDRGDIDGCSFAFTTKADKWEEGDEGEPDLRTVLEVKELFDVGPVVYPAYPDTSIAARSLELFRSEPKESEEPKEEETDSMAEAERCLTDADEQEELEAKEYIDRLIQRQM